MIGKQIVGGIVLAALVGIVLLYAINIASFVGLRVNRTDVTPVFRALGGLLTATVAFGLLLLLAIWLLVKSDSNTFNNRIAQILCSVIEFIRCCYRDSSIVSAEYSRFSDSTIHF